MINFFRIIFIFNYILLVSGCSFVASRVVPINDIKSPTGDFKVGTQIFYWIDENRERLDDTWLVVYMFDNITRMTPGPHRRALLYMLNILYFEL